MGSTRHCEQSEAIHGSAAARPRICRAPLPQQLLETVTTRPVLRTLRRTVSWRDGLIRYARNYGELRGRNAAPISVLHRATSRPWAPFSATSGPVDSIPRARWRARSPRRLARRRRLRAAPSWSARVRSAGLSERARKIEILSAFCAFSTLCKAENFPLGRDADAGLTFPSVSRPDAFPPRDMRASAGRCARLFAAI